ncbi:DNA polymerase III subunit gamma and tau [Microbacterium sp. zg.Y1090]|uniref:DNA polymerase III subunit gamma and tau n=1 Tax=Microbacterium TaxID=33882 RepID=UPI00214BA7B0|nr:MULTISPECIES: DNA polymerase III subunit gamma and tau [unclassified Microbacterium]MCR2812741.1 DNA polymerase III subunit gamma and tau [Microbacterium sp. zg.Y1084]MCR2817465.1 DNA polymerase III subunit gamma and tau [Microbacterium sp. zg.Y1090]WIM29051.1 DNA polymerase III subunit gamma and tau [Microbacterium sp. zg-Y1090]
MTTALYRRYRPEAFGEMIGQSQVTDPLMTALRGDRVGHAYLFSGPRGCGKTTSARILARCLNCAEGPTDTPCGTCPSCVELGRNGGGSLDVVEIDAASHNGVDDARDLRERAIFAPARDRFKIFILDEAHMVTPQGFNALLKLVEEPPDHVKFIFATTEPDKVIGTIRSRTHHYPFRLVAPAAMLEYVQELCTQEGVEVETGVLPLVVRAGGGSPRDTLSLLDQLIAGSDVAEGGAVRVKYERAVALLGYTHAELLDEVVEAFGSGDAAGAFAAVDRVVQTGQDPRRFVDDLLERLRDLIIVAATGDGAAAVLRGVPEDELERMGRQAVIFGTERLSRTADLVVTALDDMTGATSPRLQLELMVARVLAQTSPAASAPVAPPVQAEPVRTPAPAAVAPPVPAPAPRAPEPQAPASPPASAPAASAPVAQPASAPVASAPVAQPASTPVTEPAAAPAEPVQEPQAAPAEPVVPAGPITFAHVRDAWPEILKRLEAVSRTSWLLATVARVAAFDDDVLTLAFQSQADVAAFKKLQGGQGPSEDLRGVIQQVLGIRVKYIARHDTDPTPPPPGAAPAGPAPAGPTPSDPAPGGAPSGSGDGRPAPGGSRTPSPVGGPSSSPAAAAPVTQWAVAPIPADDPTVPAAQAQFAVDDEPEDAAASRARVATLARSQEGEVLPADAVAPSMPDDEPDLDDVPPPPDDLPVPPVVVTSRPIATRPGVERYGEPVIRQMLGATFVREEPYSPPTRFN